MRKRPPLLLVLPKFPRVRAHRRIVLLRPDTDCPADIGKVFATVVTSNGGAAITLAPSESGTTTTFAGHTFTACLTASKKRRG
jgi:hypothetical protein